MHSDVLLIGVGGMGIEYAKVLQAQKIPFTAIGRGKESAEKFTAITGMPVMMGGLEAFLKLSSEIPRKAIVAVNIQELANIATILLDHGVTDILLEKPGGFIEELWPLFYKGEAVGANIFIAYNRRFYSSTKKAVEMIIQDGGVTSFTFNFTERSYLIEKLNHSKKVKSEWFFGNSTHVIDLAFFLGGKPKYIYPTIRGSLNWHPLAAVFVGSGLTENGALFSYHANWDSPGNWNIDLYTKNCRLILNPLEELYIQKLGSTERKKVPVPHTNDVTFKPGFYNQVSAFFNNNLELLTLQEHCTNVDSVYKKMLSNVPVQRG